MSWACLILQRDLNSALVSGGVTAVEGGETDEVRAGFPLAQINITEQAVHNWLGDGASHQRSPLPVGLGAIGFQCVAAKIGRVGGAKKLDRPGNNSAITWFANGKLKVATNNGGGKKSRGGNNRTCVASFLLYSFCDGGGGCDGWR